jgi:hypothetical protein
MEDLLCTEELTNPFLEMKFLEDETCTIAQVNKLRAEQRMPLLNIRSDFDGTISIDEDL